MCCHNLCVYILAWHLCPAPWVVKSSLQVLNFWEQEPVQGVLEKVWRLVSEHLQNQERYSYELDNIKPSKWNLSHSSRKGAAQFQKVPTRKAHQGEDRPWSEQKNPWRHRPHADFAASRAGSPVLAICMGLAALGLGAALVTGFSDECFPVAHLCKIPHSTNQPTLDYAASTLEFCHKLFLNITYKEDWLRHPNAQMIAQAEPLHVWYITNSSALEFFRFL